MMKPGMYQALERIAAVIEEHKDGDPERSYVARLTAKGGDRLQLVRETADLWFHCMIVLAQHGLGPGDVLAELHRREGISGIDEKASRGK